MNKDRPESANEIEIAITPIELLRACASGSNELLCETPDWMIVFEDADMKPEVFTDHFAAQKRFEMLANNWNCHLFQRVESA